MHIGDYAEDYPRLNKKFTTRTTAGVPSTLGGSPVITVYKKNDTTPVKTSAESYITLTADFNSKTGLNNVLIDLSGDVFFEAGEDYEVVISTGVVNSVNVAGEVVFSFSIENRSIETVADDVVVMQSDIDILTGTDGATLATSQPNYAPAKAGAEMAMVDGSIKLATYDGSTAFPLVATDSGATQVARVGADGDTLETLSDQIDNTSTHDAADAADAVWNEAKTGHIDAGKAGEQLWTGIDAIPTTAMRGTDSANTTTPPTADAIADGVWDEAISEHTGVGSFGAKNQKVVPSESLSAYKATGFSTHAASDIIPKKNQAFTFNFPMVDDTDHNLQDGLSVSGVVIIDGAATTPLDGSIAEVSDGIYRCSASADDFNGDDIAFLFTATGADPSPAFIFKTAA